MDDNIVDGGEYSTEDRLVLMNADHIPEVLKLLAEDKIPHFGTDRNLRTNQEFIYSIRRYHPDIVKMYNIKIKKLPKYFNWKIVETDRKEQLMLEFPWAELVRSYVMKDETHPLREAIENGEILGIEDLEPYVSYTVKS